AVVQIAGDPPPLGVLGLQQPAPRPLQFGDQRVLLGDQALLVDRQPDDPGQDVEQGVVGDQSVPVQDAADDPAVVADRMQLPGPVGGDVDLDAHGVDEPRSTGPGEDDDRVRVAERVGDG